MTKNTALVKKPQLPMVLTFLRFGMVAMILEIMLRINIIETQKMYKLLM